MCEKLRQTSGRNILDMSGMDIAIEALSDQVTLLVQRLELAQSQSDNLEVS